MPEHIPKTRCYEDLDHYQNESGKWTCRYPDILRPIDVCQQVVSDVENVKCQRQRKSKPEEDSKV